MKLDDEEIIVDDEEIIIDEKSYEEEDIETDPIDSDESDEETEEPETVQDNEDEEDDRVVTIGEPEPKSTEDEEDTQEAPGWVKKVRKTNRMLVSENKRFKKELERLTKPKEVKVVLGEKPTLASCDYDEAKYDKARDAYSDRKRKVEDQNAKEIELVKVKNEKRQTRQRRYVELKEEHKFKDFSEVENLVENTFNLTQQEIIVQGAEDSALLVYALGKNTKKLEELASIKDPVEFAFKVAKLESKLKVTSKKAPRPEKRVSTGKTSGMSGNSDKVLARLRSEAEKTGDMTKVAAYKRKLRKG